MLPYSKTLSRTFPTGEQNSSRVNPAIRTAFFNIMVMVCKARMLFQRNLMEKENSYPSMNIFHFYK